MQELVLALHVLKTDWDTSFEGSVSTSNHLLPTEPIVRLTTSRPILWCIEVKPSLPSINHMRSAYERYSDNASQQSSSESMSSPTDISFAGSGI